MRQLSSEAIIKCLLLIFKILITVGLVLLAK